jgi:Rps23 Pro-64 3,4-dihydroxylase Tpa1-like proline 4-hydroxylase
MSAYLPFAPSPDIAPELNPQLNRAKLAEDFRLSQRIHIPGVLTEASAARLSRALQQETNWTVTFNKGMDFLDVENVSPEERARLSRAAFERARGPGFHYIYDNHRLSRNGEPYGNPAHYLAKLVTFLNAPNVLQFMREVTGLKDIAWADAQATLYRQGDFLTAHDDKTGGHKRLAAYVLNMTPAWRPDWGGVLQFIDERGHIAEGYVPSFNALNLFKVPTEHAVSQVAVYGGFRYSVTGWFHGR